jgi:uncharacterized protein YndB with AHSA1/START domain
MWTEPEHFAAWYGPEGASVPVATMDVRVGGRRRVCMEVATGDTTMRMWFGGEYLEVEENRRLVYTESMTDEEGIVLSPSDVGMPPGHPATTEVHVDLVDLGGRTRMVMTHAGVPEGSSGAAGWSAAFDRLATHIGGVSNS